MQSMFIMSKDNPIELVEGRKKVLEFTGKVIEYFRIILGILNIRICLSV